MSSVFQANVPFTRLLKLNKPETPWALLGCCASGVLGAQMPAFAIALSSVINVFYETVRCRCECLEQSKKTDFRWAALAVRHRSVVRRSVDAAV